jgi:hypothetical protein
VIALILFLIPSAFADITRDTVPMELGRLARPKIRKAAIQVRQLIATEEAGSLGTLAGAKYSLFLNDIFFTGAAAYGGLLTAGNYSRTGIGFGGLVMGLEERVEKRVGVEAALLLGWGGGRPGGSLALEPSVSVVQGFRSWQLAFNMSYLYLPNAHALSGVTLGLSFEKRIFSLDFLE